MINIFKQARLDRKILISDVADKICYPKYIIEALENDKTDFLPKPYNFHCAKNYAQFFK